MSKISRILLSCCLLVSVASATNHMYWVCPDPNGLWDIPANWENSPGDPDFDFPGDDPTGGSLNKAYAVIQQREAWIYGDHAPTGRVERIYVGGPSGGTLALNTTQTVNAYKFYTGNGSGWNATINHYNGTLNVLTGGSAPPYLEFGTNGGDTTYNLYGGTFASNYLYGPHSSSPASISTINVDGGIWQVGGRAWLGSVPDAVFNVNLSSGSILSSCLYFYIGVSGGTCYFNQTGGTFQDTGAKFVPVGWSDGHGEITISGGNFDARVPVIMPNGVFRVVGSGASNISMQRKTVGAYEDIGFGFGYGTYGDGNDETLAVELDASGITPIRVNGGGYANLRNGVLSVAVLDDFVDAPGTVYPILYASAAVDAIWEEGLRLVVLDSEYSFEWFIEDDTINGGQWLKLRQLPTSLWTGGVGQWDVASNWQGGVPNTTQNAAITDGQVSLPTSGVIAAAQKLILGGNSHPELIAAAGSQLNLSDLDVASLDGDAATINITGGEIDIAGEVVMASAASTSVQITQTFGSVDITGSLNMGYYTGASSTATLNYDISGGTFMQTGDVFHLGYASSEAYFNQTGGAVTFNVDNLGSCRLGYADGWAEYVISGGSLACSTNFVVQNGVFAVLGSSVGSISMDRMAFADPDNPESNATFQVGLDAGGASSVVLTSGKARFYEGSQIEVVILPGFSGSFGSTYDILETPSRIMGDLNVICLDPAYTFDAYVVVIPEEQGGGEILRLEVGFSNDKAYDPLPADDTKICIQDALSWTNPAPSQPNGSILCDVLISDAESDPNFLSPVKVVDKQPISEFLATLSAEHEYLWRIDVYDQSYGAENKVIGDVWSFTTNVPATKGLEWNFDTHTTVSAAYEQSIHPDNISVTASSWYYLDGPLGVINSCGLLGFKHCESQSLNGTHWTSAVLDWTPVTAPGCSTSGLAWIKFEFNQVYDLGELFVWNHNGIGSLVDQRGMKNVTIEYSADGSTFSMLGTYILNDSTHAPDYLYNNVIDFGGIAAKSVVLTAHLTNGNYGGDCVGLAEVRFGLSGTVADSTTTGDVVGSCVAMANCDFVDSTIYGSVQCAAIDDGLDSIYSPTNNAGVVTLATDSWTINFYLYTEQYPQNGLLLVGFGDSLDLDGGAKRYVDIQSSGRIGFWSDDVATDVTDSLPRCDLRKWQLITVNYDGKSVNIYKNAVLVASMSVSEFANDAVQKATVLPATGRNFMMSEFHGMIDNVTLYSGVLSLAEMEDLAALIPIDQDLNIDAAVDNQDLQIFAADWLSSVELAGSVDTSNLVTWSEGFEDGDGFKARWTAYSGDWSGKAIVEDASAPEGDSALEFAVPSNYISRSIGSMSDVFETSWYYRASGTEGSSDLRVSIVDSNMTTLVRVRHTMTNGQVRLYTDTSSRMYSFVPGVEYVKVTLRLDASAGRCVLFIDDQLLESNLSLSNPVTGPASAIVLQKATGTYPEAYIDQIVVAESVYGIYYPVSDLNDDGFVDFMDYSDWVGFWMFDMN